MCVSIELKNFKGISLPVSARSVRGLWASYLNLLCFAAVAIKKHTHHRTTISYFLFIRPGQDLCSLKRPSAHKSLFKKWSDFPIFAGVGKLGLNEHDFNNCRRSKKEVKFRRVPLSIYLNRIRHILSEKNRKYNHNENL